MRTISKVLLASLAALITVGTAAYAASRPIVHHLTINVPDFGVERIEYTGNVAPKIVMLPAGSPLDAAWPAGAALQDSPFAMMDRIAAQMDAMNSAMDRRMAAAFSDMRALQNFAVHEGQNPAILASLPSGAQGYTVISTMSGNGICARSLTITNLGNGARPQVVSHTSGDCGDAGIAPAETMATRAATHTVSPPEGRHSI